MKTISLKNILVFVIVLISCQSQAQECDICGTYYWYVQEKSIDDKTADKIEQFLLDEGYTDKEINNRMEIVMAKYKNNPISKDMEKRFLELINEMGNEYININANGSWEYYMKSNDSEPSEKGIWEIKESPLKGKIINLCVGEDNWELSKNCVMEFGTIGVKRQYIKWTRGMFYKK